MASGRESDFYFDGKIRTSSGRWLSYREAVFRGCQGCGKKRSRRITSVPIRCTATSIASFLQGQPILIHHSERAERPRHRCVARVERFNPAQGRHRRRRRDNGRIFHEAIKRRKRRPQSPRRRNVVDREEGGRENIEKEGYWLRAIFTKSDVLA